MKQYINLALIIISALLGIYVLWLILGYFFPETFAPKQENPTQYTQNTEQTSPQKQASLSGDTNQPQTQQDAVVTCTREYDPVCGTDGNTYGNACVAKAQKITVAYTGECREKSEKTSVSGEVSSSSDLGGDKTNVGSLSLYDTGSYHHYKNSSLQYSFAIPKFAWYQGYGAREGARHTMAIGMTASGVIDFPTADVRVYLFKKTPANPPSGESVSVSQGIVYIDGDSSNPKIKKIIETVIESVE